LCGLVGGWSGDIFRLMEKPPIADKKRRGKGLRRQKRDEGLSEIRRGRKTPKPSTPGRRA